MYISEEDKDVFAIVASNPRRQGGGRTVGYIVPQAHAEAFAVWEAQSKRFGSWRDGIFLALAALAVLAVVLGVAV